MKSLYKQIDNIFNSSPKSKDDDLLYEILNELKEIKEVLKNSNNRYSTKYEPISEEFYQFITNFRESLKADVDKDIYPEVEYKGRKYGINNIGLLYDKNTSKVISKQEAFRIYRYFYKQELI